MGIPIQIFFDCIQGIPLASNIHLFFVCSEWTCYLFDLIKEPSEYAKNALMVVGNTCKIRDGNNILSINRSSNTLHCNISYLQSELTKSQKRYIIVAFNSNHKLALITSMDICYPSMILTTIDNLIEPMSTMMIETGTKYTLVREGIDLVIKKSNHGIYDASWMFFENIVIPITYKYFFESERQLEENLQIFKNMVPGDKVEISEEDGKYMIELVVPDSNLLKHIPTWYIPQKFRIPSSIVIKLDDVYSNIPFESIQNVYKSHRISTYCREDIALNVGNIIVLYAPNFPIGKVIALYEKYYVVECSSDKHNHHPNQIVVSSSFNQNENSRQTITLQLRYREPLFKIFEKRENAETWRNKRIKNLRDSIPYLRPGDVVMCTFKSRLETNPQTNFNSQGFRIISSITVDVPREDQVDMDQLCDCTHYNNIDEESIEGIHYSNTMKMKSIRYHLDDKSSIGEQDIQEIIFASDADTILLKGYDQKIKIGDVITYKAYRKNVHYQTRVDRIIYGGIVLDGTYYPSDKITVKNKLFRIDEKVYSDNSPSDDEPIHKKRKIDKVSTIIPTWKPIKKYRM